MKEKINRQDVLIEELTTRVRCDETSMVSNPEQSKSSEFFIIPIILDHFNKKKIGQVQTESYPIRFCVHVRELKWTLIHLIYPNSPYFEENSIEVFPLNFSRYRYSETLN